MARGSIGKTTVDCGTLLLRIKKDYATISFANCEAAGPRPAPSPNGPGAVIGHASAGGAIAGEFPNRETGAFLDASPRAGRG
jgi:hypothetical protein